VSAETAAIAPEALRAYSDYERQIAIRHLKVGCWLVICLMPAGVVLDYFVYRDHLGDFLWLRLACSALAALLWGFLFTRVGQNLHRHVGLAVAMLPVFFISWMIYETREPSSPYYAGLNLILLAIAFILRWDVGLSLSAVVLVVAIYLTACFARGPLPDSQWRGVCNNLYFLVLTGIIVISGSRIHRRLRGREFELRYALDQNREELEKTNQRLVEMDQIKSRFFANISHELRTPLTLLIAPLETLQHQRSRLGEAELTELLGGMHSNAMRLLKLINDLLDLIRVDSGVLKARPEPVELSSMIRGLASAARQVAEGRRLRLETTIDPEIGWVMIDRDKLEKIVLNLQFNALKFTPAGGRVDIVASRVNGDLVIEVRDTGVGISEKNLPYVFSRFWQADNSARRKYQGVGIGLALVKELAELQGGKVAVRSQEGKGTTFTVRLPFVAADEAARKEAAAAESMTPPAVTVDGKDGAREEWLANLYRRAEFLPATGSAYKSASGAARPANASLPKVLIADDEPDMLGFLRIQLQNHYQVLQAVNGAEAVVEATRSLPDLIILDMMMPEKDGLQVCRELREQSQTRSIPIVLITARADEETKLAGLKAGANDFLPKPFSTTELHVRLRNLLDTGRFQKELARQNQRLEETIDDLKETETQLVQTEKLASLGRMSAGLIHEINNPLNYAKTGLYALRQHSRVLPERDRAVFEEVLGEVEDGVNRVRNIVSELGPFARQHPAARDLQEAESMVEVALRFLSHEWKDAVRIEKDFEPGLKAYASRNQVVQVLVNLLQNSLDALKSAAAPPLDPVIRITGREQDGFCLLSVRDNGPGIPEEIRSKIFEPFFTTKDVGAGMGLGLNICYRIAQAHGGSIEVRSEPGRFSEFTLRLPAREPVPASA